ncbi:MAG: tetratricopeptide repeat protein, partial [Myxococcales bacterium]|nr:tetratricopeptide repeat protein [Myxococcales bacterium]
ELVRIHEANDRPEEALSWVERLVASCPEDREALSARARLQQELGDAEAVRETLERLDVLLTGEEQAENRRRLGALYRESGHDDRAIVAFQGALSAHPEDKVALTELVALLQRAQRWEELAEARRELAEHLAEDDRRDCLLELAELLRTQLDKGEVAITVLSGLAREYDADQLIETRLETLLEEHGHFEELLQRLAKRRSRHSEESREGRDIDLRRAELLVDELRRPGEAAQLLRELRVDGAFDETTGELLERALRAAGDSAGLCEILAERASNCEDPEQAARIQFERAAILEDTLAELDAARAIYEEVAASSCALRDEAAAQIDRLLEQTGAWEALRERLEERIEAGDAAAADHDRLAELCRDRIHDRDAARAHLEQAVKLDPSEPKRWQSLARLYEEDGAHEQLLHALEGELDQLEDDRERELVLRARAAELCRREVQDLDRAANHYRRMLVLDPTDAAAAEFLVEQLEDNQQHGALAALLNQRLELLMAGNEGDHNAESEDALRLRIASLRAGPLDDPEGAIAILEPAARSSARLVVVAPPLADLYQRTQNLEELADLAERAAERTDHASERANWLLRLADAQRNRGDDDAAAEAYRRVLSVRPDDRDAESALRDIYRRLGESLPLANLLEAELSQIGGPAEVPVRLELASLLEGALARPEEALVHINRVLQLEPHHPVALERALALCQLLGRGEERLGHLETALALTRSPSQRAHRLCERGELLMELERFDEAVECYEQAAEIDPSDLSKNRSLRSALECVSDYEGVLRCIGREAAALPLEDRTSLYEEAAAIAEEHLGDDETLCWLERLRASCPKDGAILARIAAVHERAARPEAVLRAHEAELALSPVAARRAELELARAEIYEKALNAPGRAIGALEAARENDPRAREVLRRLARLYELTGRSGARADALEALIGEADAGERTTLRKDVAKLCSGTLANPERAIEHLWAALTEHSGSQVERIEILSHLGSVFRAVRRTDLWARVAEEELRSLHPEEPVFAERRNGLHRDLARSYSRELGRLDAAVPHWRALVAADRLEEGRPGDEIVEEAELELLRALRALRSHVELERRLALRLERHPNEAALWLELGRLRAEQLHRPGAAAEAFRRVLEADPQSLPAIRGLRAVVQRLGRWEDAAETLQMEIDLPLERGPNQLAALYRRLGDVCWRHLDSTTRASGAFAAALEACPEDLRALRSLQQLFETMEDWRGLHGLFESEVEILGEADPERRQEIWLRAGALCRDRLEDTPRALRAYEQAAALAEIPTEEQRAWAELYHDAGQAERFCEVFAAWCDAPGARPEAEDHLRLAGRLAQLSRLDEAAAHAARAAERNPGLVDAWDELASLRERLGDCPGAAAALENGAGRLSGSAAAQRNHRAAQLVQETEPERAVTLYEKSLANDPARASGHAALARIAARLGQDEKAREHAERALFLETQNAALDAEERLDAALIGARAARALGALDAAARMYRAALECEPEHPEALSARGEVLVETGDHEEAARALRARLDLAVDDPDRAVHLALLGICREAMGDCDDALRCFREALGHEPDLDDARSGTVRLLEASGEVEQAVDALKEWAERAGEPDQRAARLLHAATLELDALGRE